MRGLFVFFAVAGCHSSAPTATTPCTTDCESRCADKDGAACAAAAEVAFNGYNGTPMDLAKSFALSQQACELGDGFGCALLGMHYQDGRGAPWDHAKALATYDKACTLGAGVGCYNLESMYVGGHGVVADRAKATALHAKARAAWDAACHGGAPRWCTNLGFLVQSDGEAAGGSITAAQRREALALDQRACAANVHVGCGQAALMQAELGELAGDAFIARLESVCKDGDPGACAIAGLDLALGGKDGVAKDEARGRSLLRRSCERGDKQGCYDSAIIGTQQVPPDEAAITRELAAACDRGYGKGCIALGKDAMQRGVPAQAVAFAERACQIGEAEGCAAAADLYLAGTGVPKDDAKGMTWAREACSQGVGDLCFTLIAAGIDPPVAPYARAKVFADACKQGIAAACPH